MPKVSVIIPTFNRCNYLPQALESVLQQTYQDFEIIIVDDGSTDATENRIQEYLNAYPDKIRYKYQGHKGVSAARNLGLLESQGEYIAFLDSDDIWLETKLAKQVEILNNRNEISIVHTAAYRHNMNTNQKLAPGPLKPARCSKDFLFGGPYILMTVLIRRNALFEAGMFDETMVSSEDTDLYIRIAQHGEIFFIDELLAVVRIHNANMKAFLTLQGIYANRIKMIQKTLMDNQIKSSRKGWIKKLAWVLVLLAKENLKNREYQKSIVCIFKAITVEICGRNAVLKLENN